MVEVKSTQAESHSYFGHNQLPHVLTQQALLRSKRCQGVACQVVAPSSYVKPNLWGSSLQRTTATTVPRALAKSTLESSASHSSSEVVVNMRMRGTGAT